MTLTGQLDEPEQGTGELGVVHVLLARGALGTYTKTCTRTRNILFVRVAIFGWIGGLVQR